MEDDSSGIAADESPDSDPVSPTSGMPGNLDSQKGNGLSTKQILSKSLQAAQKYKSEGYQPIGTYNASTNELPFTPPPMMNTILSLTRGG